MVDVVVVGAGRTAETVGTKGSGVGAITAVVAVGGADTSLVVMEVAAMADTAVETDPHPLHL